jgi:hypothetical protein
MALYGYGKILDVGLSKGTIDKRDIDLEFTKKF